MKSGLGRGWVRGSVVFDAVGPNVEEWGVSDPLDGSREWYDAAGEYIVGVG